jgi:hypothetical protein
MRQCVEIRAYTLKSGTRADFHRLFVERSLPMLHRWQVDVVAYGSSPHDADSYYLIRAYESLEARAQSQDAFYGSAEWREGPRESLLALVENYATAVLELDEETVKGLRLATG